MEHARENVWDYPRPPALERVDWPIRVEHGGVTVARSDFAFRILETTHPPVYYLPPESVQPGLLRPSRQRSTHCEWKGSARYLDLHVDGAPPAEAVAWTYPNPVARFADLRDAIAFYPGRVDACFVDGERVKAQAGDFYGGWITSWIDGGKRGFKGGAGTWGW